MEKAEIITVSSNKGGVGKTSMAITTGIYFSIIKKVPTLILELDSSPGDFASLFDINSENNLEMAIRFPEHHHKYTKKISENLFVMGGIANPAAAETVKRRDFFNLLRLLEVNYKNIIVDTQTVFNGLMIDAYLLSKKIFLISDYALESISRILALYRFITKNLSIPENRIDFIINKKRFLDFLKVWDYSKMTGVPLAGFICFDRRFNKSCFLTNYRSVLKTRFYRQLKKVIENEYK